MINCRVLIEVELIGAAAFWNRPGRNLCKDEEESADVQVNRSIMRERSASLRKASSLPCVGPFGLIRVNFKRNLRLASFAHKQR